MLYWSEYFPPGRTKKFPGYAVGLAGLFVGLGEILGNLYENTYSYFMDVIDSLQSVSD